MAGIEAHAYVVGKFDALDNRRKLLERATHFSTLARHGFEQHRSGLFRCEHLVEKARNELNAAFGTLLHVTARVEVVVAVRHSFHTHQIVCHAHAGEFARLGLSRARVERIGGMRHQRAEIVFDHELAQCRGIGRVNRLGRAAARVAREKRERIRAKGKRRASHGRKTLRGRQVASNSEHRILRQNEQSYAACAARIRCRIIAPL